MENLEEVIRAMENCTDEIKCRDCSWKTCEEMDHKTVKMPLDLAKSALALLKEQEAVQPKKCKGYNPPMYTLYEYECNKCKSQIMYKQPYCMGCGRAVKWDG